MKPISWTVIWDIIRGDVWAGRLVPPERDNSYLITLSAFATAIIASVAVIAALSARAETSRWRDVLAQGATIILPLDADQTTINRTLLIATETPGVVSAAPISSEQVAEALAPWVGDGVDLTGLERPGLIELQLDDDFDPERFRLRLSGEIAGASLDDHGRWQGSLNDSARSVERLAVLALVLIAFLIAALTRLAAEAVLARHKNVLKLLRQVGAEDTAISRAFVRSLTLRSLGGAAIGAAVVLLIYLVLPSGSDNPLVEASRASGGSLLLLIFVPVISGVVAYLAARFAVVKRLREVS